MTQQTLNTKANKYHLDLYLVEDLAQEADTPEELDYILANYTDYTPLHEDDYYIDTLENNGQTYLDGYESDIY